jgi:hypothetical protein
VCYFDDRHIYSTAEKEHKEHVQKVLQRLQEFGLNYKAEKCQFGVSDVGFHGFLLNSEVISMETDRISTIEDWPTPKSVREVQVLRRFINFYLRFIRKYGKVTLPLTELLKKADTTHAPKQPSGSSGGRSRAPQNLSTKWE